MTRIGYLAVVLAALVGAPAAHATTVASLMSLEAITSESGRIVHGTVTEVASGRDESDTPATWVTLQIARTLKGTRAERVTFKQFGSAAIGTDGALGRVAAMPRYAVGEEVVLFLRPESGRGFTSPVGLDEGVYRVGTGVGRRATGPSSGHSSDELAAFLSRVEHLVAEQAGRRSK